MGQASRLPSTRSVELTLSVLRTEAGETTAPPDLKHVQTKTRFKKKKCKRTKKKGLFKSRRNRQNTDNTETDAVAPNARLVPVTIGSAAVPGSVVPRTATKHTRRIFVKRFTSIVCIEWITQMLTAAPFPHVPVHIVQPPGVRLFLSYGMRATFVFKQTFSVIVFIGIPYLL